MNVEKLHAVTSDLRNDYQSLDLRELMAQFLTGLEARLSTPGPDLTDAVDQDRELLQEALTCCAVNDFSPSRQRMLAEIGGADLCGSTLGTRVDEILARGLMDQGDAVAELSRLFDKVNDFFAAVEALESHFGTLGVTPEVLDQAEIGVLFPASRLKGDLGVLGSEITTLDGHLKNIVALTGADAEGTTLKAASNGGIELFIGTQAPVAAVIAEALTGINTIKRDVARITEKRGELTALGVPDEVTMFIEEYEVTRIGDELDRIAEALCHGRAADPYRHDEQKPAIQELVRYLAERTEQGVTFEVNTPNGAAADSTAPWAQERAGQDACGTDAAPEEEQATGWQPSVDAAAIAQSVAGEPSDEELDAVVAEIEAGAPEADTPAEATGEPSDHELNAIIAEADDSDETVAESDADGERDEAAVSESGDEDNDAVSADAEPHGYEVVSLDAAQDDEHEQDKYAAYEDEAERAWG